MTTERLFAKNCVFKSQNNCDTRELQKKNQKKEMKIIHNITITIEVLIDYQCIGI